jgi:hypothetical protein
VSKSEVEEDLDVLTGGVEDLEHALIGHEVEQRLEVDALGERVDRRRLFGAADLHQAEDRPIGLVAHEFGVDRDECLGRQPVAERRERRGVGNDGHGRAIHANSAARKVALARHPMAKGGPGRRG